MQGLDGWGESSVEELVHALEKLYTDQALTQKISRQGTHLAQSRSWRTQTDAVLTALDDVLD
jgi:hypothetical protein